MHRALIVCNSVFPEDRNGLPPLRGPVHDGLELWRALTDDRSGCFPKQSTQVLFERTNQEILEAAEELFTEAGLDDILMFYYSGHGRTIFGDLLLCGRNTATNQIRATSVSADLLGKMISETNAKAIVVILDCCHGGAFKGEIPIDKLQGRGRFIVAAASAAEFASDADRDGHMSPFTSILTEGLLSEATDSDGDNLISIDDLYRYVWGHTPDKHPRPTHNFDGAGTIPIARRTESEPMIPATVQPKQDPVRADRERADNPHSVPILANFKTRLRNDLTFGDVEAWKFYTILGLIGLTFYSLAYKPLLELNESVDGTIDTFIVCAIGVISSTLMVIVSLIEFMATRSILRNSASRRVLLEALDQSRLVRYIRYGRDALVAVTAILILIEISQPWLVEPFITVALTSSAASFVVTVVSRLKYGDAAYIAGATIVGASVLLPGNLSSISIASKFTGIGFVLLLIDAAMFASWLFAAKAKILGLLAFLSLLASVYGLALVGDLIGASMAVLGASLALIAALLGNGTKVEMEIQNGARSWLGSVVHKQFPPER